MSLLGLGRHCGRDCFRRLCRRRSIESGGLFDGGGPFGLVVRMRDVHLYVVVEKVDVFFRG